MKWLKKRYFRGVATGVELTHFITPTASISSMQSIVYHQYGVLDIIKPQNMHASHDDMHLR